MYLVNKGFANSQISASKGKVIDIKDKSLATALESAGFVTPYSEKAMSNKEMEKTIKDLTKQLNDKDSEIQTLSNRIAELEEELNLKSEENTDDENKDNLDSGEESSEDNKDSEASDDENKGDGSNPDDKSKKEPKTDKE